MVNEQERFMEQSIKLEKFGSANLELGFTEVLHCYFADLSFSHKPNVLFSVSEHIAI
jgi:hypothetical protein